VKTQENAKGYSNPAAREAVAEPTKKGTLNVEIIEFGSGVGNLKAGCYGEAGTGKTTTAVILANGIKHHFNLPGGIWFFDTESGGAYVNGLSRDGGRYGVVGTGKNIVGTRSRAFSDLMTFMKEAEKAKAACVIVDSMTHVWAEVQASMLAQINKVRAGKNQNPLMKLEFQHTAQTHEMLNRFSTFFLNSDLNIIICGRAGNIWKMEQNEDTGRNELNKVGTKMRVGSDMAYEPSLLFEMEVVRDKTGAKRVCTIWKDRFGVLDGQQVENPTLDFFMPHLNLITRGSVNTIDATTQTPMAVGEDGNAEWDRERRQRVIACENLQGLLMKEWPGMGAQEKLARQEVVFKILGTRSWAEVENTNSDKLKAAIVALPVAVAEVRQELAEREAKEAAQEAAAKAEKKAKPAKAEKVEA